MFQHDNIKHIPEPIRGGTHHVLDSENNYESLCALLDGAAGVEPTPVQKRTPQQRMKGKPIILPYEVDNAERITNLDQKVQVRRLFVGRTALLKTLQNGLQNEGKVALTQTQVIHGLGGVRKDAVGN